MIALQSAGGFRRLLIVGAFVAGPMLAGVSSQAPGPANPVTADARSSRALLDRYCVGCHNDRAKTGGLSLQSIDVSDVAARPDVWEKVIRKVNAGMMPLVGQPRPTVDAQQAFVSWLQSNLDRAAAGHPNPGRTETFHRLNRTEYQNVVRDLLAVDVDVSELLPPDDAGYGFDNMAGVLRLSQSLMERYLSAARKISRAAVGGVPPTAVADTFGVSSDLQQYDRAEGLPFGTRGGKLIRYSFPRSGQYVLRATFSCALVAAGGCDASAGFDDLHQLEFTVDGQRVALLDMPPRPKVGGGGFGQPGDKVGELTQDPRWQVRVPIKAGVRNVGVAFLKLPSYETSDYPRLRFVHPSYEGNMVPEGLGIYQPHLASVTIAGPFDPTGDAPDTESRRRIFACHPSSPAGETDCARTILGALARRAYRRPVTGADVEKLLRFYQAERKDPEATFESSIEMALRALLVSSEFLFRIETDPVSTVAANAVSSPAAPAGRTGVYRISDLDLASRLSFFLWSSIPDEELLDLAARGRLREPAVLDRQVRRMLGDPRAAALSTNFLPQWLNLRPLQFAGPADPDFDESLRSAMLQETILFFDAIARGNRPATELVTANYTFLNERLAWHYGIPNVKGSHFRRVVLADDSPRRGLLGQASILTATSFAIRTSPVKRGKWILSSVLGVEPPPPPPNVPMLEEKNGGAGSETPLSMRERMAAHRKNPVCAGCHSMIDPVGFALENFDPTGRWRTVDATMKPINPSGQLPDGSRFTSLEQFRAGLAARPDLFAGALTERLMTYAIGRGLEPYDMPAVRAIVRQSAAERYAFSSLLVGIVRSVPFQMRTARMPEPATAASIERGSPGVNR